MSNYELIHYGIPGMKWGVRRTDAQLARVKKEHQTHVDRRAKERGRVGINGEETTTRVTTPKGPSRLSTAQNIAGAASSGFNAASRIAGSIENHSKGKLSKQQRADLDKMSDAELKARVNRLNLEQQYANLSSNKVTRGAATARTILEVAGSAAALTGSALTIALAIKKLRGK